jgi:hypothetical protein
MRTLLSIVNSLLGILLGLLIAAHAWLPAAFVLGVLLISAWPRPRPDAVVRPRKRLSEYPPARHIIDGPFEFLTDRPRRQ